MAYTTIDDPSAYFNILLYTGNGASSRSLTYSANAGNFKPDLLWFKQRSQSSRQNNVFDSSRGNSQRIETDNTGAEEEQTALHKTFDTNGFTIGAGNVVNENTQTFVSWGWKANGGTETHSQTETGTSLACSTQANSTALFSITTYTGTGTAGDKITHGLGVVPAFHITKKRSGTEDWLVYHHKNTTAPETDHMLFNTTDATSDSDTRFNDTAPTSTLITYGTNGVCNGDDSTYVNYAFAEVQGYSKFGGYIGNGNADGTFVYTGFKPAFVITKRSETGSDNWHILDHKRDIDNPAVQVLQNNEPDAEGTTTTSMLDFLSNGFKCRGTGSSINTNATDYIYIAFAEQPFVTSGGVPCTAR